METIIPIHIPPSRIPRYLRFCGQLRLQAPSPPASAYQLARKSLNEGHGISIHALCTPDSDFDKSVLSHQGHLKIKESQLHLADRETGADLVGMFWHVPSRGPPDVSP